MNPSTVSHVVRGPAGSIAAHVRGDAGAPAVLMSHSILSSSMMWEVQAALLAARGLRVILADTRGHGKSTAPPAPYSMSDLVGDVVAVLDSLGIARAHYVGLSLGGMTGFGLGIHHADRIESLCLCDCRADAPAAFLSPWDDRIAAARAGGCAALADATTLRWFGQAFVDANPQIAQRFRETISATSVEGLDGCAHALMKLDYLPGVARITAPTTLIVGSNDGPLPHAMADLQSRIAGSVLRVIPGAGHLPNIDQAAAFNAALIEHFDRIGAR